MNLGARFDLARGKDLTLGVLMERLAAIHGDRPLVTEAESGRVRTFRQAAADVDRWAGAIHALTEPGDRVARWAVVTACLVTIAVYLVPHSLRGSQLDYGKVEGGSTAKDAITTGR